MAVEDTQIEKLYKQLLDCWNRQDAKGMASLFARDGNVVGFDGSQMNGKMEIESEIGQIFSHHQTASYVEKIREIRFLGKEINPSVNAIQSLIAVKDNGTWHIALFQNTPARFHERPELAEALTRELQQEVQE